MSEYLSPGVYIEELSTGPVPIEGVSTSTAGFVGQTERGPTTTTFVTSFTEYMRWFGGFVEDSVSFLPYAVKGFFDNGGQRAFIARVTGPGALPATLPIPGLNLTATAQGEGDWGSRVYLRVGPSSLKKLTPLGQKPPATPEPLGFRLTVLYFGPTNLPPVTPMIDPFDKTPSVMRDPNRREPDVVEDFDNLLTQPGSSDYVLSAVRSRLISLDLTTKGPIPFPAPDMPFTPMGGSPSPAATWVDYVAEATAARPPHERRGLQALDAIDDIELLCIPDQARMQELVPEIMTQCERRKDRFAILQAAFDQDDPAEIYPPVDSSYGAFYASWIRVTNDFTGENLLVPPGGHIAGIYANTDVERGVHKAPANVQIGGMVVRDIDGNRKPLQFAFNKGDQDLLNPRGVNCLRDFRSQERGIRVWGARTMSSDGQWKYINVRRLFIFVEQSIQRGTQWVVFEPNDEELWARVTRSLGNFLTSVWRSGALMGDTAAEAFFVKCDRTTMTQDDIDNGRLICQVGIAPVKPAEFVKFVFSQKTIDTQS